MALKETYTANFIVNFTLQNIFEGFHRYSVEVVPTLSCPLTGFQVVNILLSEIEVSFFFYCTDVVLEERWKETQVDEGLVQK